jgi:hypothetical protein
MPNSVTAAVNASSGPFNMRRLHLFEIEDFAWFPSSLRDCLTQMLIVVHRLLKTSDDLAPLVERVLRETGEREIVDLCSGSGGPMLEVAERLRKKEGLGDVQLKLTDLYPIAGSSSTFEPGTSFYRTPVDATEVPADLTGLRTMVCSFHHMPPDAARKILDNSQRSNQPICIFEISDNSVPPPALFWGALPFNFLFALFVSLKVRPMTWRQIVFTWLIPILPICFAWDGAVSNVRTYSLSDLDELLVGLDGSDYRWEKGTIDAMPSKKLYLLGVPAST